MQKQKQKPEEQTHNLHTTTLIANNSKQQRMERNKPLGWKTNNFRLMYESGWIVVVDG